MNIKCFMVKRLEEDGIQNVETGEVYPDWAHVPPGAMWFAPWLNEMRDSVHFKELPEAVKALGHIVLKTPAGDWDVDSPSANGTGWTRIGTPPIITARPSIGVPWPEMKYHGFLTDGELAPC